MAKGSKHMPMMRLKPEDYEKLEEMAVEETARKRTIIPVSEMMKIIIDKEYQRFRGQAKKIVKGCDETVKKSTE